MMRFCKMHGAGNDFVVLDASLGPLDLNPALAARIADRHTGIGCDQIMVVEPGERWRYRIYNADGSAALQCGNGARCVARYLHERHGVIDAPIDSPSGTIRPRHLGADRYSIELPAPTFAPDRIPFLADAEALSYAIDVDGRPLQIAALSMGNPHAVLEVADVDAAAVDSLGPALSNHPRFPQRANVGFAQWVSRRRLRLRVFERGVGETLACGSGACAAAIALMRFGKLDDEAIVALPGGELTVTWRGTVTLAGPTAFVFEGVLL